MAPYGLGVTILLAGTFDTDITGDGTPVYRDDTGPYAAQHPRIEKRGRDANAPRPSRQVADDLIYLDRPARLQIAKHRRGLC